MIHARTSPVINDTITFPLKVNGIYASATNRNASKLVNKEQIGIGGKHAQAYGSGSAMNKITTETSQVH